MRLEVVLKGGQSSARDAWFRTHVEVVPAWLCEKIDNNNLGGAEGQQ